MVYTVILHQRISQLYTSGNGNISYTETHVQSCEKLFPWLYIPPDSGWNLAEPGKKVPERTNWLVLKRQNTL